MAHHFWPRALALLSALLITLAIISGLFLVGAALSIAVLAGTLISSIVCLGVGAWRRDDGWALPGFIQLGGTLVAALAWINIVNWWWPLGLVALGVAYVPLASLLPGRLAAGWRAALDA